MKKICVIGAGPSGIVAIKELLAEGHDVICYEASQTFGGVFSGKGYDSNKTYDGMMLTISNYYMAFSDFPPEDEYKYWTGREYLNYLKKYVKHFDIERHIKYNSTVTSAEQNDKKWFITTNTVIDEDENRVHVEEFDGLVVCSGTHQSKKFPNVVRDLLEQNEVVHNTHNNIDNIHNNIHNIQHSSSYIDDTMYKDKNVLVIGMGETSADLVRNVSNVSKECHLVMRSYPFCIPRLTNGGLPVDSGTNRLRYPQSDDSVLLWLITVMYTIIWVPFYLIYSYFNICNFAKWWNVYEGNKDSFGQEPKGNFMDLNTKKCKTSVEIMADWHTKGNTSHMNKFATKNVSWLPNVVNGKINVHVGEIISITKNGNSYDIVVKGESINIDIKNIDIILCCTGYVDEFSFFAKDIYKPKDGDIKNLFKHAFNPQIETLCFIGFSRPTTGAIPACSELVARYFALICSGKRCFPEDMEKQIREDKMYEDSQFYNSKSVRTVVNPTEYMDSVAKLIGCYVSPYYYVLNPRKLLRWLTCINLTCRYRIYGPQCNKKMADKWLEKGLTAYSPYQCLCISFTKLMYCLGIGTSDFEVDMRNYFGIDMMRNRFSFQT